MANQTHSWTPYRYSFNNPLRFTDPTGMSEEDESETWTLLKQGFLSFFNNKSSNDDGMFNELENLKSEDQKLVEGIGRQAASGELGEKVAKMAIEVADGVANEVGDNAKYVGVAGIVLAPFTAGSSLTLSAYAFTTSTVCDGTSLGIRLTNAIIFDESFTPALEKGSSALFSVLSGRGLDKAMGQLVTKTGLPNTFYRAARGSTIGGQFIKNSTGISVEMIKFSIQSSLMTTF